MIAVVLTNLLPNFVQGTQQLRDALLVPAALICYAGLIIMYSGTAANPEGLAKATYKLVVTVMVISQVQNIGDILNAAALDLANAAGFNINLNVFKDYQTALATKFNIANAQGNLFSWLFQADLIGITGLSVLAYFGSVIAACMMFFMLVIQQILFYFEIALSPLFLACVMVPSLRTLAVRWGTSFVAIAIMPLGFTVVDLLVKALLDVAVNTTNNAGLAVANNIGGSIFIWTVLAVVIFFGYPLSAIFISKAIVTSGNHGLGVLIPAMWGLGMTGAAMVSRGASTGAAAAGAITSAPSAAFRGSSVTRPGFANV